MSYAIQLRRLHPQQQHHYVFAPGGSRFEERVPPTLCKHVIGQHMRTNEKSVGWAACQSAQHGNMYNNANRKNRVAIA